MKRFQHGTERWLRSQASLYRACHNRELAGKFTACANEVKLLKVAATHIYNSGYHAGHHDTVEGSYVDIVPADMDTYHTEEVAELLAALVGEEGR